jgi:hypothetical protein
MITVLQKLLSKMSHRDVLRLHELMSESEWRVHLEEHIIDLNVTEIKVLQGFWNGMRKRHFSKADRMRIKALIAEQMAHRLPFLVEANMQWGRAI